MLSPEILQRLKNQHESVYNEIIVNNQYHISEPDLKGKIIVDIGANNGTFTLLAHDYGAKKIIAIESNPTAYAVLCDNVKGLVDIEVLNKAAASTSNKKVKVGKEDYYGDVDGRCYVVESEDGNIGTVSINDLLSKFQGEDIVLKIDCEGSEYDILYSIDQSNFNKVSEILLEAHEGMGSAPAGVGIMDKLSLYLQDCGFSVAHRELGLGMAVQMLKFVKAENFKEDITVLISGFVRPEYLKSQIEALNNQTVKPDKIIVLYTKPYKEFVVPFIDGVDFIVVENDQGLNTRFAVGLVARTKYLCIMDDDLIPGSKWLETSLNVIKKENAVLCGYGVRYDATKNEHSSLKFGDHGENNETVEEVDMAGHSWFMKREWLKYFWIEEPLDWTVSDDMHLSYTFKKYGNLKLLVSPHPKDNPDVWCNTKPELGLGKKALHARKSDEVVAVSKISNDWNDSDIVYLKERLDEFLEKRKVILSKYDKLGTKKVAIDFTPEVTEKLPDVTCSISTKDRYFSTLPHTLLAICHQTYRPKYLYIFDDSKNKKDLRGDFVYGHIFALLSFYGITWEVIFTQEEGQVANHIRSVEKSPVDIIWRVDDDAIPEPTTLERLLKSWGPKVGAVGGLVIQSNDMKPKPCLASNKIEDIYLCLNEQWYPHPDNAPIKEVDHLYSTFIYRKSIAEYNTDLSVVGHREETLLTYNIKLKGYSVLLDPSIRTWHWRNPEGGIRSHDNANLYSNDERVFQKSMNAWKITPNEYNYVVLDNGVGDHFSFKANMPAYLEKYKDYKKVLFTTYPEVFYGVEGIQQASIADAKVMFGELDKFNIYRWMIDHNWDKGLPEAFAKMNKIPFVPIVKEEQKDMKDFIIISPYSFFPTHAKSYPFWDVLIPKIKTLGYKLIQIGRNGETPLKDMDDYWWGLSFSKLEEKIKECRCWVSVDNFLQHMVNSMDVSVKGIVLWGPSDPDVFGYKYNTNILKDKKYLRPDQFGNWKFFNKDEKSGEVKVTYFEPNRDAYQSPEEVIKVIGRVVGSNTNSRVL